MAGLSGLGQTGIPPGGTCYDATHDVGEIHCANLSDVVFSAIPIIGGGASTTTCSAQELACLSANPGSISSPDVCSKYVGVSCGMFLGLIVGGFLLISVVKK